MQGVEDSLILKLSYKIPKHKCLTVSYSLVHILYCMFGVLSSRISYSPFCMWQGSTILGMDNSTLYWSSQNSGYASSIHMCIKWGDFSLLRDNLFFLLIAPDLIQVCSYVSVLFDTRVSMWEMCFKISPSYDLKNLVRWNVKSHIKFAICRWRARVRWWRPERWSLQCRCVWLLR